MENSGRWGESRWLKPPATLTPSLRDERNTSGTEAVAPRNSASRRDEQRKADLELHRSKEIPGLLRRPGIFPC